MVFFDRIKEKNGNKIIEVCQCQIQNQIRGEYTATQP